MILELGTALGVIHINHNICHTCPAPFLAIFLASDPPRQTMFFNPSDMHIFDLGILLTITYALYCHFGPASEVYTWIFRCCGYPPVLPSISTATPSPTPAQHSSKRRVQIHSLPLHLNSFHSRHIRHRYQPPPPYRPPQAVLIPGILNSDQPSEAPVSTPTDTITLVKVPLPTRHSIGVPGLTWPMSSHLPNISRILKSWRPEHSCQMWRRSNMPTDMYRGRRENFGCHY